MKNADLEALLKTRGLPTGGKKADMVDRLTKDDEKSVEAPASSASKAAVLHPEDEIDWDDDAEDAAAEPAKSAPAATSQATTSTEPSAAVAKAGGEGQTANPQAVPNQVADIDPSKTDDLSVKGPAEETIEIGGEAKAEEKKEPPPDYTRGLAASSLDEEIEKRKARAKKFGLNIEEDEGLKKLERAKKFGETGPPKGLDEALPERTRKRGREDTEEGGRNKRRGGGKFGGRRGRGNRDGNRGGERGGDGRRDNRDGREIRDNRREDRPRNGGTSWMSEADRAKAEARKNKFAAPAASS